MADLLFDFDNPGDSKRSLKRVAQAMFRAGQPVVSSDVSPKVARTSGVSYRTALLTLASGQTITLLIKLTGDVFRVLLNGVALPIKNQDGLKAIAEIAAAAEANQTKFQAAQARKKVELPKGIRTAAPRLAEALQARQGDLDAQIAEKTAVRDALKEELAALTLDSVDNAPSDFLPDGTSWLDFQIVDQAFVDKQAAIILPSAQTIGGQARLKINIHEGAPLDVTCIVVAVKFSAPKVYYSVAVPIRLDGKGGPPAYAVLHDIDSIFLSSIDTGTLDSVHFTEQLRAYAADRAAVLDGVKKHNQKGYAFYVVTNGKIESGWEYAEDAKEHKAENMPEKLKAGAKVLKTAGLKAKGIDPDDNASWLTSVALDAAALDSAVALAASVIGGEMLDAVGLSGAISTLQVALQVVENNYPINVAEGNQEQADLEAQNAESFRKAISLLEGQALDGVQLSDAAEETLRKLVDGPLEDGDVPSKAGRDELQEAGLIDRYTDEGDNVISESGQRWLTAA